MKTHLHIVGLKNLILRTTTLKICVPGNLPFNKKQIFIKVNGKTVKKHPEALTV